MIDRDKAIQMAKEAELPSYVWKDGNTYFDGVELEHIEALLNRVRNEALEEAAALCDKLNDDAKYHNDVNGYECATAIRALKQENGK